MEEDGLQNGTTTFLNLCVGESDTSGSTAREPWEDYPAVLATPS